MCMCMCIYIYIYIYIYTYSNIHALPVLGDAQGAVPAASGTDVIATILTTIYIYTHTYTHIII